MEEKYSKRVKKKFMELQLVSITVSEKKYHHEKSCLMDGF